MRSTNPTPVSFLGLGAMGTAQVAALVTARHPTVVWNRTPGKADDLVRQGATEAKTVGEAVTASELIIACLLDRSSVHEQLDPVADRLAGKKLINLTTTTPKESRELAAWATEHKINYLDGAIMAIPSMIGKPGSALFYSGSAEVFNEHKDLLDIWGTSSYFGEDAGMAALYDLAMLSGMYVMFAGFLHGAAMVGTEGIKASEFASLQAPFLSAMTGSLAEFAQVIDGGDYTVEGQQSLDFSDLGSIVQASADQGISTEVIGMVQTLIRRQIDAGHGSEGFARIFESIKDATASSR